MFLENVVQVSNSHSFKYWKTLLAAVEPYDQCASGAFII